MTKETVLVTGSAGLLGNIVIGEFKGSNNVYGTWLNNRYPFEDCNLIKADLRNKSEVLELIKKIRPSLVIHTAALTNVDYCEEHPEEAQSHNVTATANIAEACKSAGSKLIFISTDFLFDGKKEYCKEEDMPNPINVYGKTKHDAEKEILRSGVRNIIIRTTIYGWNIQKKQCFPERVVSSLRNMEPMKIYTDQFATPILVTTLAKIIRQLHEKNASGLFHIGCDEKVSRYEFALKISDIFGLDSSLIMPVKTSEHTQVAPRPVDVSLGNSKIKSFLNLGAIPLEKDLEEMKRSESNAKIRKEKLAAENR